MVFELNSNKSGSYIQFRNKGWIYVDEWEGEDLIDKYISKRKRGEVQLFNWLAQYINGNTKVKPHFMSIELEQVYSKRGVPRIPEILRQKKLLIKNFKSYNANRNDGYPRSSYVSGALKTFLDTFFDEWKWIHSDLSKKLNNLAQDAIKNQLKSNLPDKIFPRLPQLYLLKCDLNKFTHSMIKTFFNHFKSLHCASKPYSKTSPVEHDVFWRYCDISTYKPNMVSKKPEFQLTMSSLSFKEFITNIDKVISLTDAYRYLMQSHLRSMVLLNRKVITYDKVINSGFKVQINDKKYFYNERHPDGVNTYVQTALMDEEVVKQINSKFKGIDLPLNANFVFTGQSRTKGNFLVSPVTPIFEDISAMFDRERNPLETIVCVLVKNSTEYDSSKLIIDYFKSIHDPLEEKMRILMVTIISPEEIPRHNIKKMVLNGLKTQNRGAGIIDIGIYPISHGIKNFGMIFGALSWVKTSTSIHSKPENSNGVIKKTIDILKDSGLKDINSNEIKKLNSLFDEFSIDNLRGVDYDTFLSFLRSWIKIYGDKLA